MKVVLINPQRLMKLMIVNMNPAPSLGLGFIAAALKKNGHSVQIIDALAEGIDEYCHFRKDIIVQGLSIEDTIARIDSDTDVIGFTLMFSGNWMHNRLLIDAIGRKFPRATLIAGGEHLTACPEFCISQTEELDICVLGEGEDTVVNVFAALESETDLNQIEGIVFRNKNNQPQRTLPSRRIREVEAIAWPAWDLFPLDLYRDKGIIYGVDRSVNSLPIMATRGCPYTCTFCSSPQMWGTRYFMRSPQDVVDEIAHFKKRFDVHNFDFYDLTAIIKKQWIIDFCKELLKRNLNITWQIPAGTRSEAIDAEVAHYLYKSGCRNITYAPESGSKNTLSLIKKKINLDNMLTSIKHSSSEGMNIKINFILGFPNETHLDIWKSLYFLVKASRAGVYDMVPSVFSPYPGSELFDKLRSEGKINLVDDNYFIKIINVDSFFQTSFYNEHVNVYSLRIYVFLYLLVFYGSNFIFHPNRLIKTIKNVWSQKYESRGEMALGGFMKQMKIKVNPDKVLMPYEIK
jgi:radical SAM superfamily enzyme YgiQ (UPF0313 family)